MRAVGNVPSRYERPRRPPEPTPPSYGGMPSAVTAFPLVAAPPRWMPYWWRRNSMPTYEYACKKCGEHIEVVQSFKDEPLTECPACGGPLRKVFAPVGIVLKGSGFYRTDNRAAAKSGKRAKSEGTKSEGTKSEGTKS